MPPPRRVCSLAGGLLLLFFCLSFVADQLDTGWGGRVGHEEETSNGLAGPPNQIDTPLTQPAPHNLALIHPNLSAHKSPYLAVYQSNLSTHTPPNSAPVNPFMAANPNLNLAPMDPNWPLPPIPSFNGSSLNSGNRRTNGGVRGQCKKKYWRCDSPPTDPEPPLEELQELENLPAQAFTAPHWSQYANRGYTVIDRNESAYKRLPDVLIIGAKKSGTRALLAFLRIHPNIRASGPEVHYFDRFYPRGLDWYKSKLPVSLAGQLTVEKSPAYFTTPGVPARVRQDLPKARLLLVVRDPVTRALSDYTQSLSKHKSRRPFEELAFVRSSPGLVNSEWGPISGGLYARHLQRWLDHFPRRSIHVVSGENLIRDPAAELCKVQEFLGLRRVITEKHFFFNVTKGFPCLVKREKTGRPHCLGSSKGRSHPPVSQATYNTLRDFFRPFNFKFYKMVGQNFKW